MGSHFRAFGRREVNLAAILTADSEVPRSVRLLNVSLGGACIEAPAVLAPGSGLTLEVAAPTLWDPLVIRASVVWSVWTAESRACTGMQFRHTRGGALRNLVDLLRAERFE